MREFLETGWGKFVSIVAVLVVGAAIVLAGLAIGAGIGLFSGVVLPEFAAITGVVIVGALVLALVLVIALQVIGKATDDLQKRISKERGSPGSSWAQYLGAVVGVLVSVGAGALGETPLLALLFGVVAAVLSALAASLVEGRTWLGLLIYAVMVAGAALVVAFTTTPRQLQEWLAALTPTDIIVIAITTIVVLSPLAAGLFVKLRRRKARTGAG